MNYHSIILSKYLGDDQLLQLLSDEAMISKMLLFENMLAKAQAETGTIPKLHAEEISKAITSLKIDPADLAEGTRQHGVPVISLLGLIKAGLSEEAKKHLHYGTTSQDVIDTAQILMIRDVIKVMEKRIADLINHLNDLLKQYGTTPCMSHTRGQQAIPMTFGIKINAWKSPLLRQLIRLDEIKERLLVLQLGGPVGTLSAYPDKAPELIKALSGSLDLAPASSWHTQRDNICEFMNWVAMLTGILGKMGADILFMSQSEVNEIMEQEEGGQSSAMPHKNNPVLSEALVALSRINAGLQSQILQSLVHVNERDASAWILEWNAIPQMLINAGAALNHALFISTHLQVNILEMKKHVEAFKSLFT